MKAERSKTSSVAAAGADEDWGLLLQRPAASRLISDTRSGPRVGSGELRESGTLALQASRPLAFVAAVDNIFCVVWVSC